MRLFIHHCLRSISLSLILAVIGFGYVVYGTSVAEPVSELPESPLMITAYYNNAVVDFETEKLVGSTPAYIEIYNDSDEPIAITDWSVTVSTKVIDSDELEEEVIKLGEEGYTGYIAPKNYSILSFNESVIDANFEIAWTNLTVDSFIQQFSLSKSGYKEYVAEVDKPETTGITKQRLREITNGYTTTGDYTDDERDSIYQNELYLPLPSFPLMPIEVLPNSEKCAPNDTRVACGDYVKFYNNTDKPVDFSGTRLRVGYKGQNITSSNAIPLAGVLHPGHYAVFNKQADKDALNLTNSGGYVWLEDTYGMKMFDNTIVNYPSASSKKNVGYSWAYDHFKGEWSWAEPNPFGTNKPVTPEDKLIANVSSLKPCDDNQYRSKETNRCRLIKTASSQLKPCDPDQYRSKETNRCRSTSTASTRKPCNANQFRNPESGRCKLKSSSSDSLKPCKSGWERNSETNRCRKVRQASADVQGYAVEETPTSQKTYLSWWIAIGIGCAVLARIVWEWRVEIGQVLSRFVRFKR